MTQQCSSYRNRLLQPFLKWAGGKRQLLPILRSYLPKINNKTYFEPFIGAGAVLFDLQPKKALINDTNRELVNCYQIIKDNYEELLEITKKHQENNTKEYYYKLRAFDRESIFENMSNVERAARMIYLNKTCYNGLFRVNSQGQFNVPYGNYKNPIVANEIVIKAVSRYLNENNIEITNKDFQDAVSEAKRGDFIYFDPPYDPLSETSSFTGYDLNGFDKNQQRRLKTVCDDLTVRGCKVLLSNSATQFIQGLYSDKSYYSIIEVKANRSINSVATGRGKINEALIFNYKFK